MELSLALSILAAVISVASFVLGRKDKSNKETGQESYRQGMLDQQLKTIFDKLEKIEKKLDKQETEFDQKIEKAISQHIQVYHNN